MNTEFERLNGGAGCRTQTELADLLGIRQSSVAEAKRRGVIPPTWLFTLLRLKGINPDWVITGAGPKYLAPAADTSEKAHRPAVEDLLKRLSIRELAEELVRRVEGMG